MNWDKRALQVLDRLHSAGHRAVFVGGCVRDSLLSVPLHDYDAATSARPEEVLAACADLHCVETGLKHGTVTVFCEGLPVEVTTFRKETGYSDHRHPDGVEYTDELAEDLSRRDFTVNAMAWEPTGIVDLHGGQEDLANRRLRCVGDPDRRFEEDALRLLRGLRLAAQLEFDLHPDTADAIRRHADDLRHVAQERICAEFLRLLCSPGMKKVLLTFPEVICRILPELTLCVGFDQKNHHHCYDVYTHCVIAAANVPPIPALRLAALLHDVGKPKTFFLGEDGEGHFYNHDKAGLPLADGALKRLRTDRATRERVTELIGRHHLPVEVSPRWAGRWLTRLGEEVFFQLLHLKRGDALACNAAPSELAYLDEVEALARGLLSRQPCLSLKTLAVDGTDCIAAGLEGKEIGAALRNLLERVSEGLLPNDRNILLNELKKSSPS